MKKLIIAFSIGLGLMFMTPGMAAPSLTGVISDRYQPVYFGSEAVETGQVVQVSGLFEFIDVETAMQGTDVDTVDDSHSVLVDRHRWLNYPRVDVAGFSDAVMVAGLDKGKAYMLRYRKPGID